MAGFHNIELFAPLKPFDEWPRGLTKDKLTDELSEELSRRLPRRRLQLLADDQRQRRRGRQRRQGRELGQGLRPRPRGEREERRATSSTSMSAVPGVKDLGMFRSLGQPSVKITPDRASCARYGLNTGDVDAVIQAAIGGQAVTQVFEGEKRFDLTVRWLEPYRSSIESIREITVATPAADADPARADRQHHPRARGRPSSTARTGSATRRSSSACAGAISRARSPRRSRRSASACTSPTTRTSSGPARSTSSRRPRTG